MCRWRQSPFFGCSKRPPGGSVPSTWIFATSGRPKEAEQCVLRTERALATPQGGAEAPLKHLPGQFPFAALRELLRPQGEVRLDAERHLHLVGVVQRPAGAPTAPLGRPAEDGAAPQRAAQPAATAETPGAGRLGAGHLADDAGRDPVGLPLSGGGVLSPWLRRLRLGSGIVTLLHVHACVSVCAPCVSSAPFLVLCECKVFALFGTQGPSLPCSCHAFALAVPLPFAARQGPLPCSCHALPLAMFLPLL